MVARRDTIRRCVDVVPTSRRYWSSVEEIDGMAETDRNQLLTGRKDLIDWYLARTKRDLRSRPAD